MATLYPQLYTEKYMSFLALDALTSNVTLTLGDKVPNIIMGNSKRSKNNKKSSKSKNKKADNQQNDQTEQKETFEAN